MATTLRFVLLGDDRANRVFDRFARSVDNANRAVARNDAVLKQHGKQVAKTEASFSSLIGNVSGFDHAFTVGSSKASLFAKALAGVNLATGVLEPALAGVLVVTGALAASLAAGGAALGAYGVALKPVLARVQELAQAQKAAAGGSAAAKKKYQELLKSTPPAIRDFATAVKNAQAQYQQWSFSLAKPVLRPLTSALSLLKPILHAITPLARVGGEALQTIVAELGSRIQAGGLQRIVQEILPHALPNILNLAHAIGNVAAGVWGVLRAFLPMSDKVSGGVEKLTRQFKIWAMSLPSHSGFQSLMNMFKQETPLAVKVLGNLAEIIKNVAAATVGLASPANSKALLQILIPLTQVMGQLTKNQQLVRTVIYFLLLKSALGQVKGAFLGLQKGVSTITDIYGAGVKAYGVMGRLAGGFANAEVAASAFSGTAGTVGGKLRGVVSWLGKTAIAQKVVNGFTWAWGIAMKFALGPIGLLITAVIAIGAALVILWTKNATFRKIVIGAWNAVWGFLKGVWNWIKDHWPLLLAILTGPFGLAVLFIIKHWHGLVDALKAAWRIFTGAFQDGVDLVHRAWDHVVSFFRRLWDGAVKSVRLAFAWLVDKLLGYFGTILHAAVAMFGWVPGVGDKLRKASDAFDAFRSRVNASLRGVNDRTVNVGVHFGARFASGHGVSRGGVQTGLAAGGLVKGPGGPTQDRAGLFALSNDEYVMRAAAHRRYGTRAMEAVNRGRARIFYRAQGGPATGGEIAVRPQTPSRHAIDHAIVPVIFKMAVEFAKTMMGSGAAIAAYARRFATGQGHPYVWGGTRPSGWDCSGFTGYVYKHFGYNPPRTSQQQQLWARPAPQQPGALVFFYGTHGAAGHVGIALGGGKMVNASSPAVGTIISGVGGNTGFGIPPGGFHGSRQFFGGGGGPAANKELARAMAAAYGWTGREFVALRSLWMHESGFRSNARNRSSGAAGIPQDISGNMHGGARGQIAWGLRYILQRYGDPIHAWRFWRAHHWYGGGGPIREPIMGLGLRTGQTYGFGEHGGEHVSSQADMAQVVHLLGLVVAVLRHIAHQGNTAPERTGAAAARALNSASRSALAR